VPIQTGVASTYGKFLGLVAAALLCTVLVSGAQAGRSQAVELKFATYVWQPTTVAATKNIVDAWNRSHSNIQVEIVSVDPNSVHDKLLTNFVGGTAADVIHDEAADIAGFTEQGYLANLNSLIPKDLKQSIPKDIWATVNFGRKITGVPSLLQTYNVFANMDIFRAAGIKAPTLADPWTWAEFRAIAKRLKTQQELACRLWETGDTAARLLAILICRPKAFGRDELDVMLREARTPKVHDWLLNSVVAWARSGSSTPSWPRGAIRRAAGALRWSAAAE